MSATIKRYTIECSYGCTVHRHKAVLGKYVLHADHLASHAYDEAKERAAAFAACPASGCDWGAFWQGWLACAKSRAKRAGGNL